MKYEVWNGSFGNVMAEFNSKRRAISAVRHLIGMGYEPVELNVFSRDSAGCVGLVITGDKLADEEDHSKEKKQDEEGRRCQDTRRGGRS